MWILKNTQKSSFKIYNHSYSVLKQYLKTTTWAEQIYVITTEGEDWDPVKLAYALNLLLTIPMWYFYYGTFCYNYVGLHFLMFFL